MSSTPASRVATPSRTRPDDPSPIIAREGWIIVLIFVLLGAGASALAGYFSPLAGATVGAAALVLTLWCVWFFRDPRRSIPDDPGLVVSAADGVVVRVDQAPPPEELSLGALAPASMTRVVVFLNIFNVHVNRAPLGGTVVKTARKGGLFAHAGKPAAELNARASIALRLADGSVVAVTQVTGLIARRIINRAREGQALRAGERFGLIRFGSRTDVYLPAGYRVHVTQGQKVMGGVTVIAQRNE